MKLSCCRASCSSDRCLDGRPMGSVRLVSGLLDSALAASTNIQVTLPSFDQHHLEVVVQVGQSACHYTAA